MDTTYHAIAGNGNGKAAAVADLIISMTWTETGTAQVHDLTVQVHDLQAEIVALHAEREG